jgi:hypothetical protein
VNIFAMYTQKSAPARLRHSGGDVIVATSNEPLPKINRLKVEALQGSEGLNVKQLLCRIDPPIGGSYRQRQQERKENKNLCKQLMQY